MHAASEGIWRAFVCQSIRVGCVCARARATCACSCVCVCGEGGAEGSLGRFRGCEIPVARVACGSGTSTTVLVPAVSPYPASVSSAGCCALSDGSLATLACKPPPHNYRFQPHKLQTAMTQAQIATTHLQIAKTLLPRARVHTATAQPHTVVTKVSSPHNKVFATFLHNKTIRRPVSTTRPIFIRSWEEPRQKYGNELLTFLCLHPRPWMWCNSGNTPSGVIIES